MNRILILLIFFGSVESLSSQELSNIDSSQIYVFVDSLPTMPDGSNIFSGIRDILHKNLQYPDSLDCGLISRINFELVVKYDGSIINKKVSIPYNREDCENDYAKIKAAGMKALNKIPKCRPGMKDRKYVSVKFIAPTSINLQ